jgi:hypothetical protein
MAASVRQVGSLRALIALGHIKEASTTHSSVELKPTPFLLALTGGLLFTAGASLLFFFVLLSSSGSTPLW